MEASKLLNFIKDVLKNMPTGWLSITTHRLDIYEEKLAKTQFLEQLENLEAEIFKGKTHLKRGQGISKVSHTITKKYLEFIEKQF